MQLCLQAALEDCATLGGNMCHSFFFFFNARATCIKRSSNNVKSNVFTASEWLG